MNILTITKKNKFTFLNFKLNCHIKRKKVEEEEKIQTN